MIHNTIKKIKNLRMAIYIAQANHVCNMIFCSRFLNGFVNIFLHVETENLLTVPRSKL